MGSVRESASRVAGAYAEAARSENEPLGALRGEARPLSIVVPRGERADVKEEVHDPSEIAEILALLARDRHVGRVNDGVFAVAASVRTIDLAEGTMSLNVSGDVTLPALLEISDLHAAFDIPLVEKSPGKIALPERVTCRVRRRYRRVPAPQGMTVRFLHPISQNEVSGTVLDFSRTGLSFKPNAADLALPIGLPIASLSLYQGEEPVARLRASVRTYRLDESSGVFVIGVATEPHGLNSMARFEELLDSALYPSTNAHANEVWDVHTSSGYLSLSGKTPEDFERLRGAFVAASTKLTRAPSIASIAHWPRTGPVLATISHFKAYQSTWLVCQLSKRKGGDAANIGRAGIRDMYLRIYETAREDPETRWLLSYVQDLAPRWSRAVHVGIPQRYASLGDAVLIPFRALEAGVGDAIAEESEGPYSVTVADAVVARQVVRDLHRVRPAQYLDALDLTEGRVDLATISSEWRNAGLSRRREMFVAKLDGIRMAVAVAESAEPGVHLYGLMDCVRMYPLRPGGEACFRALLAATRRWFARQGRDRFAYLEEFPVNRDELGVQFADLGGATLTLLAAQRIPELLRKVADLASTPPPKSSPTHSTEVSS